MPVFTFWSHQGKLPGETDLPARITKLGSRQTYYTFRLLADRDRKDDAFRAYAYFRWLDDLLDSGAGPREEKKALINRQQQLFEACLRGMVPEVERPQEQMLVDLVRHAPDEACGMQVYLRNMMKVMAFDVERRGRVISHAELTEYTHLLSSAVTELLYYLIGHKDQPTAPENRYHAVYGAHIVHMLRDTVEDVSGGYFNMPAEFINDRQLTLDMLNSLAFRKWVYQRVKLARHYFTVGRKYIDQVKNLRCRLAGYAYLARFEWMLRLIERDQYCLHSEYPERKSLRAVMWMAWRVFSSIVNLPWIKLDLGQQEALADYCEE